MPNTNPFLTPLMKENNTFDTEKIARIPGIGTLYPKIFMRDYADSFVFSEEFTEKRFARYLKKTEQNIIAFLKNCYRFEGNRESLPTFILYMFFDHMIQSPEEERKMINPLRGLFFNYGYDIRTKLNPEEFLTFAENNEEDLLKVSEKAFVMACKTHITECWLVSRATDKVFDIGNYHLTTPDKPIDFIRIINNMFSIVSRELEYRLSNYEPANMEDEQIDLGKEDLFKKQLDEKENKIKELISEIASKNAVISSLKAKIDKTQKDAEELTKPYVEENFKLQRQLLALQKKNETLQEEIDILKEREEAFLEDDNECNDEVKEDEILRLNTQAKYVFIMDKDLPVSQRLRSEFPNAVIKNAGDDIHANSTDVVIALTKSITHSAYASIKNQCIAKNIPFMHCHKTNVDYVKKTICEYTAKNPNVIPEGIS